MIQIVEIHENKPFPNNSLPVLFYKGAAEKWLNQSNAAEAVLSHFERNGYGNGWVNGIFNYHHFHSTTHEALTCIAGEGSIQLGGPGQNIYTVTKGDVLLLPAGIAHKKIKATKNFQIVGLVVDVMDQDLNIVDSQIEKAKEFVQKTGADYPHLLPNKNIVEDKLIYSQVIPETIFVNNKGQQIGESILGSKTEEQWRQIIDEKIQEVE